MTTLLYFHYDLCVNLINQEVYRSLIVNHSIYTLAYLLVGFVVSSRSKIMPKIGTLGVCRKSIPPVYHTPNLIDPWRTSAQLKKLNGSPERHMVLTQDPKERWCHSTGNVTEK